MRRITTTAAAAALALLMLALPGAASARGRHHSRPAADRNHDRIPDAWERRFHLSLRVNQANHDPDHDGLSNLGEFRSHTSPRDADTDNDGVNDANEDRDRDGVDNGNEMAEHTNPSVRDTNHNGRPDGREDADHDGLDNHGEDVTANDPENRDTDGDGIPDGQEQSGTVRSFDGTTLVLTVGSGTLTGAVNAGTRISCEGEREHEVEQEHGDDRGDSSAVRASRDGHDGEGEGGGDHGDAGRHDGQERTCSSADLTPGTRVHEAELEQSANGPVFDKIELVK